MGSNEVQNEVNLIPFEVLEVATDVSETPKGVELINAPSAWERSEKGKNVVIAVLDTGCQVDHPELKDCIVGGQNFTTDFNGDPNNYSDINGHGTHVSGTIAAAENNKGVLGVAPQAKLLIVKVLGGPKGNGAYEWIVNGINYAVNWRGSNGERVRAISMSLSGELDDSRLHQAIKNAVANDVLVVCAAGNNGDCSESTDELRYPGAYSEVVEVGAVDLHKKIACFSNSNKNVDLVAPGEGIWSTYIGGSYAKLSGTSMATPHVSGGSALIIRQCEKEFGRIFSESEIYAQLIKRTTDIGYDPRLQGNGLLDFTKA